MSHVAIESIRRPLYIPFTPTEELGRLVIKHLPGKLALFDWYQKHSSYSLHVPTFYTLLTPLFQLIYGSNNIHSGYFESGTEEWDHAQHGLTALAGNAIGVKPGDHLLETGSGIGGPSVEMNLRYGCRVTGLNITPAHIRRAEHYVRLMNLTSQVSYVRGDALQMPFKHPQFDHAYAIEAISHMPGKTKVVGEVARVTRPGARFCIIDARCDDVQRLTSSPDFNFFNVTWGVRAEEWIQPDQIEDAFSLSGFRLVEARDITVPVSASCEHWLSHLEKVKAEIVYLYGEDIYQLTHRSIAVGGEFLKQRLFTYWLWLGEKLD